VQDLAVELVAEAAADGRHREAGHEVGEQGRRDRTQRQSDERRRHFARDPGPQEEQGQGEGAGDQIRPVQGRQGARQRRGPLQVALGHVRDGQPEEVLELEGGDHHRDPGREPGGDRVGDELDEAAEAEHSHEQQDQAGHERGHHQPPEPEPGRDRSQEDHERRRRTGHLDHRPTQGRDHRAGDDGRVEALLRSDAGGDRQRHRQRQGDDADHDPRQDVGPQVAGRVAVAERAAQSGGGLQNERGGLFQSLITPGHGVLPYRSEMYAGGILQRFAAVRQSGAPPPRAAVFWHAVC
jgi:hypothetical protein